jgi:multicomponent Na+:H+ antiporter subunit G
VILVDALSYAFLGAGTLLLLAAAAGVLRFPDFYTRLHAAGKGDTLGQLLVILGLILASGLTFVSLKLALITFFIFILNPTATHALARGAWVAGVRPWMGEKERPFVQREGQLGDAERAALFTPIHAWTPKDAGAAGEPAGPPGPPAPPERGEAPWTT